MSIIEIFHKLAIYTYLHVLYIVLGLDIWLIYIHCTVISDDDK